MWPCVCCSDEDTDVGSLVKSWLKREDEDNRMNLENWLNDYFHRALDWVLKQVLWYTVMLTLSLHAHSIINIPVSLCRVILWWTPVWSGQCWTVCPIWEGSEREDSLSWDSSVVWEEISCSNATRSSPRRSELPWFMGNVISCLLSLAARH